MISSCTSFSQLYEKCRISGYTDQQIPVFFRMSLRIQQGLLIHYIELRMVDIQRALGFRAYSSGF